MVCPHHGELLQEMSAEGLSAEGLSAEWLLVEGLSAEGLSAERIASPEAAALARVVCTPWLARQVWRVLRVLQEESERLALW